MLTDTAIRNAKPHDKLYKMSDGGGLQLWIFPDGAKRWRCEYRHSGKRKLLAVGVYPAVSLKAARAARESAKDLLRQGRDPSEAKQEAKRALPIEGDTFGSIALELDAKKVAEGKSKNTLIKFRWYVRLASELAQRPIREITAPDILRELRKIESRGRFETASRTREAIGSVFRFAIATGRAEIDPTIALKGALVTAPVQHRAAIVEPKAFGALLRAIHGYGGSVETRIALELMALLFPRPGELRAAEWTEFDLDTKTWSIPAARMKMRRPHRVPLPSSALELLKELHSITGDGRYLFPSVRTRDRCMSENTLNAALRRLDFTRDDMTAHGFRSAASSLLNECGQWNPNAIEAQLAHQDDDAVRRAYARSEFWPERVKMMEWWANKLEELRDL